MKKGVAVLAFAFLAAGVPAFAADEHGAHDEGAGRHEDRPVHAGHGKVISIDAAGGTVRLAHDPIPSLRWPKMTMNFQADGALLAGLQPGMEVDFELAKAGSGYRIAKISAAR
jgi:Cu(I)/Ag(I) efflux system membrane fusion protein/cobalt-zinc-cadmium efflux system membrane fusion protein